MTPERPDTGAQPHLHRGELYSRAREIAQLSQIIMDITGPATAADCGRAERLMKRIAAICGMGEEK